MTSQHAIQLEEEGMCSLVAVEPHALLINLTHAHKAMPAEWDTCREIAADRGWGLELNWNKYGCLAAFCDTEDGNSYILNTEGDNEPETLAQLAIIALRSKECKQ